MSQSYLIFSHPKASYIELLAHSLLDVFNSVSVLSLEVVKTVGWWDSLNQLPFSTTCFSSTFCLYQSNHFLSIFHSLSTSLNPLQRWWKGMSQMIPFQL